MPPQGPAAYGPNSEHSIDQCLHLPRDRGGLAESSTQLPCKRITAAVPEAQAGQKCGTCVCTFGVTLLCSIFSQIWYVPSTSPALPKAPINVFHE